MTEVRQEPIEPSEAVKLREEALEHVPERTACRCGERMRMAGAELVGQNVYLVAVWRCGPRGCRRVRYAQIDRETGDIVDSDWAVEVRE